ncbi:MAG TPA: cytochrome P450, partial [Acidimicrobiales bacterium]|nr:cytochrome P450 [Acidimicrobiales bacterium]
VIAGWQQDDGTRLELPVAAVELLNVLRPATAVAWFVTFAALALDDAPGWRDRLRDGDPDAGSALAHEVRRLYPFAPLLAARARTAFDWHGQTVPAGRRIVLDIYGTLHDPSLWPDPDRFDPDRFAGPAGVAAWSDAYIPHGGGDPAAGHRCPGEAATVALLEGAARRLAALRYRVVKRGPVDLARMPPRPELLITDVQIR